MKSVTVRTSIAASRALIVGLVAALAGTYPWAWLAGANLKHGREFPWGPLAMALYLCLYWYVLAGMGWPASSMTTRRTMSRVKNVSESVWGASLLAGVLGLWACVALLRLISRFVPATGGSSADDLSAIPALTLVSMALMGALVAGVVEEIAFRGYMQRPLERLFGPVVAIGVVGVVFGLAHASHTYWSLAMMPYYMAVAAVYGTLAYLTDSVLPSMALHATGDALDALLSLGGSGGAENAGAASTGAGTSAPLVVNLLVLAVVTAAAVWAFRQLAQTARQQHAQAVL